MSQAHGETPLNCAQANPVQLYYIHHRSNSSVNVRKRGYLSKYCSIKVSHSALFAWHRRLSHGVGFGIAMQPLGGQWYVSEWDFATPRSVGIAVVERVKEKK